jgi:putative ATPase
MNSLQSPPVLLNFKQLFEKIKQRRFRPELGQDPTTAPVVFIDEIHRFNKAQQDAFLPYVENGTVILIGATTENPSFEIISPLLSRSRVFVLQQHRYEDLVEVIKRALKDKDKGLGHFKVKLPKEAMDFLIEASNGDARRILNTLEIAVMTSSSNKANSTNLTKEILEEALQQKALRYDKAGDEHYDTISAFIKSMRASNVDSALYYLARMVEAGEDSLFIARRMVIFASEDIGMAQPTALVVANEVFRACETIGYPECQINLAHGVTYLASAKKDRSSYEAYFSALDDVKTYGNLPIPLMIRNAPTKLMKELDYGKGYEKYTDKDLLPEKLKGKKYYKK